MGKIIKSKFFYTLDNVNEFIKNKKSIIVININRIYKDYEYTNNNYRITHVGYELIYFGNATKDGD